MPRDDMAGAIWVCLEKNNVEENHFNKNSKDRVEVHPFSDHPLKQIPIWGWVKLPMKLPDDWGENHPATPATLW